MNIKICKKAEQIIAAGDTVFIAEIYQNGKITHVRGNMYFPDTGEIHIKQLNIKRNVVETTTKSVAAGTGVTFDILHLSHLIEVHAKNTAAVSQTIYVEIYFVEE